MNVAAIPLTAWDQIAVVIVFALVLSGMATGFYTILKGLQKDFQKFIIARDEQWQAASDKREFEFNQRNGVVVNAIQALAETIKELRGDFSEHNEITITAIAKMEERTQPLANRRRAGKTGGD